jgi:hypothetical protein
VGGVLMSDGMDALMTAAGDVIVLGAVSKMLSKPRKRKSKKRRKAMM